MIENIRKYTGLMAIVFVLLGAGFLFTMNNGTSSRGGGSGPTVLEVYGQSLDGQVYQRMGSTTLQLASEAGLHSYINFLMAPDAQALQQAMQMGRFGHNYYTISKRNNLTEHDLNRFIANRIILQKAMETMGIYASEEEITETLKSSPVFSTSQGKYDEAAFNLFVDKRLGKLGMTQTDLRDLIRESLCLNKLVNIVGGGLTPSRTATQDQLDAQTQTITLAKIVFKRDDFVEKEKPTEDEIKTYWESHQDAYKTDEKRRISYVMLNLPEELADQKEEKKDAADSTAKTDKEKAAEKAKKEADAKTKIEKEEKRRLAAKALRVEIDDIYNHIGDSESSKKPLDFAAFVTERNRKTVTTELFTRSTLPKELAGLTLRGSFNRNRPLGEDIFSTLMTADPYDQISLPLPVGEHNWIIFYVEEVVEPKLLDYTAARGKARAKLISENATTKVKQAAQDQRTAILELMKAGKGFDAAAKEKGLTPIQVGPFTLSTPPKDERSAPQLHHIASGLNPGEISNPIDENDRSLFFFLEKRELEDTESHKLSLDRAVEGGKIDLMLRTYINWINHQYAQADVKGRATEEK